MIYYIVTIIVLLLLSAFFSAAEMAYSTLSRSRLKAMAESNRGMGFLALKLHDNYDSLLSTILIGNNVVNLAAASVCAVFAEKTFESLYAVTICALILTVLILFLGEMTPKSIAHEYPEKVAIGSAPLLWLIHQPFRPINYLFTAWNNYLARKIVVKDNPKLSSEEMMEILDEAQSDGAIDKDESVLLKNALRFTECKAEDIVTHRTDIVALPITASYAEVAQTFAESEFSRLPVYAKNLDNIIGFVHLRDFYSHANKNEWHLRDLVTAALFVQKNERIDDVLKKLQKAQSQMAVVLDEYGGTIGILSMEDILEELVGEIWDEHDEVIEPFQKISESATSVDGSVDVDAFQEYFGIDLETEEPLLTGWILEHLQKVPQKGDRFTFKNLEILVSACRKHRVRRIEVTRVAAVSTLTEE